MPFRRCAFLICAASAASPAVHVPTLGSLEGTYTAGDNISDVPSDVSAFLGIPYGKPPVGNFRFQPPQSHGSWESPRLATAFGSKCLQGKVMGKRSSDALRGSASDHSEDCLFLNVFGPTRALNASEKLPVMVWIHGGAYVNGQSNNYPAQGMVQASNNSVIVVTINYRLNVFGFLGSDKLRSRAADNSTGNYGIQDQRMALQWVQDHIGAFGGDGQHITIFGESAGGNSVLNHLTQPASFPFYTKAIIESGAYEGTVDIVAAEEQYESLLKASGCADIDCVVGLNATDLVKFQELKHWGPVVDGISLLANPLDLVASQRYNNKVPVIVGSNRDEEAFFLNIAAYKAIVPADLSSARLDMILAYTLGAGHVAEVKKLYDPAVYEYPANLGNYSQSWWTYMRIKTDSQPGLGACAVRNVSRNLLAGGTPSVHNYLFAHALQEVDPGIPSTGPGSAVVPHASEIPFVFGSERLKAEGEMELGAKMSKMWTAFAQTANRSISSSDFSWEPFTSADEKTLVLRTASEGGLSHTSALRQAVCDYWDTHKQKGPAAARHQRRFPGRLSKAPKVIEDLFSQRREVEEKYSGEQEDEVIIFV